MHFNNSCASYTSEIGGFNKERPDQFKLTNQMNKAANVSMLHVFCLL